MTLNLRDLKQALKKEGFTYVEQIKSGGFASTILVKDRYFPKKKRCAKIFIDSDTQANETEFNTMKTLYSLAPDKFPEPVKFLKLKVKSETYNSISHNVNIIVMELLDPLVIPSNADAGFWLRFMTELTESLVLMHQINHQHKDIKPGNIMIKNGRFIFIDFGITVFNDVTLKETDTCACTPYFAAPEALNGTLSRRSDIYSLGATARALILEKKDEIKTHNKFGELSLEEIIKQKKTLKPMYPKDDSFAFISKIINKAMSFDVYNRHQTAVELLNDLNPIVENHTVTKKLKNFTDFATKHYNNKKLESHDKSFVDIDILLDKATKKLDNKQYSCAIDILKDRDELSARLWRAKAYISMENKNAALTELEGIEHPCSYFLKAKLLKDNYEDKTLFYEYLRKSCSYEYPPAMLAYGIYTENFDYVVKAATIYSKAFRVVAKLVQKGLVSRDIYVGLNNLPRFGNIHELDKAFIKFFESNSTP